MLPQTPIQPTIETVEDAHASLRSALERVSEVLDDVVETAGPARGPIKHLMSRRGKMLRPRLTLLASAITAGFPAYSPELAAAAELIHSASLLHDDVIDEGQTRREAPATRVVYSNAASVLAGDHCLTHAMDLIRGVDRDDALAEALQTVRDLVEGELLQLESKGRLVLDEQRYRRVCRLKTAALFVWSARAGARFGGASAAEIEAFASFAEHLGIAFQIRDDLLDFVGTAGFGKRLLDDLREGRSTLPLIFAARANGELAEKFDRLEELDGEAFETAVGEIAEEVRASGAIELVAAEVAERMLEAQRLLATFPNSPFRTLLENQLAGLVG